MQVADAKISESMNGQSWTISILDHQVTFKQLDDETWAADHAVFLSVAALSGSDSVITAEIVLKVVEQILHGLNHHIINVSDICDVSELLKRIHAKDSKHLNIIQSDTPYNLSFKTNCIILSTSEYGSGVVIGKHGTLPCIHKEGDISTLRVWETTDLERIDQGLLLRLLDECTATLFTENEPAHLFRYQPSPGPEWNNLLSSKQFWWSYRKDAEVLVDVLILTDALSRQHRDWLFRDDVMDWFPYRMMSYISNISNRNYMPSKLDQLLSLVSPFQTDEDLFLDWIDAVGNLKQMHANPYTRNWLRLLEVQLRRTPLIKGTNGRDYWDFTNPRRVYELLELVGNDFDELINYQAPNCPDKEPIKESYWSLAMAWCGAGLSLLDWNDRRLYHTIPTSDLPAKWKNRTNTVPSSTDDILQALRSADPSVLPEYSISGR